MYRNMLAWRKEHKVRPSAGLGERAAGTPPALRLARLATFPASAAVRRLLTAPALHEAVRPDSSILLACRMAWVRAGGRDLQLVQLPRAQGAAAPLPTLLPQDGQWKQRPRSPRCRLRRWRVTAFGAGAPPPVSKSSRRRTSTGGQCTWCSWAPRTAPRCSTSPRWSACSSESPAPPAARRRHLSLAWRATLHATPSLPARVCLVGPAAHAATTCTRGSGWSGSSCRRAASSRGTPSPRAPWCWI